MMVEAAQKEAEQVMRTAKCAAREEKERYEKCLKDLELQKSSILLALDEVKTRIQSIPIVRPAKNDADAVQEKRQSTSEALKKKFTMLNGKDH